MSKKQPMRVAWISLGCPKNLVDSEQMLGALAAAGCVVGAPMEAADVIVVNTCGFLAAARDESYAVIAEALQQKRTGRTRRVVVAGCLSSRDGRGVYDQAGAIDAVIGVDDREAILEAVLGGGRITAVAGKPRPYGSGDTGDAGRFRLTPPHTAYLRIAEGCSQRCSFCTIPAIRGPLRSKPLEMILREARELIADGAVELNVIAQDTTAYGTDGQKKMTPAALLRELDSLQGAEWIRLLYTYPRRFDDELIETLAAGEHVLPYVDIPLQHISTPVLKRMARGVTRKDVETLLAKLRDRIDGLAIRTSLIVGFPGETDAEFEELLSFVRDFSFDALGVFEFSPEPGTPAASLPNPVPPDLAAQRAERLMAVQREIVAAGNASLLEQAQQLTVLVDGVDPAGRCVGRYYGQAPDIDGQCLLTASHEPGTFVPARVVGYDGYDLIVQPDAQKHR